MLDHAFYLCKLLVLLGVANGAPIVARRLLARRYATPLDGGLVWPLDGRRLLGDSKTVRGMIFSVAATSLFAPLFGVEALLGAELSTLSMTGDALSSFIKRRLGFRLHSRALGLDQVPESLLPLVVLRQPFGLNALDILVLVALFFVLELWLSRLLYRLHIRDRPY